MESAYQKPVHPSRLKPGDRVLGEAGLIYRPDKIPVGRLWMVERTDTGWMLSGDLGVLEVTDSMPLVTVEREVSAAGVVVVRLLQLAILVLMAVGFSGWPHVTVLTPPEWNFWWKALIYLIGLGVTSLTATWSRQMISEAYDHDDETSDASKMGI